MSEKQLLNVKNLYVDVEEKQILHGVDLSIGKGETHVLMGPNGTGKSTWLCTHGKSKIHYKERRNLVSG